MASARPAAAPPEFLPARPGPAAVPGQPGQEESERAREEEEEEGPAGVAAGVLPAAVKATLEAARAQIRREQAAEGEPAAPLAPDLRLPLHVV